MVKVKGADAYMKKYFMIGTAEWKTTVRVCIVIGFFIGLLAGINVLTN